MATRLYSEATNRLLVTTFPEDTATHHKLIEERVVQLQEEIRALRHSQNALLPVCRLPVELLAEVFLWLRDEGIIEGSWRVKPWIAYPQVCQHWRNVALDCAKLWSNLDLGSLNLTKLMVARSRGSPLDIKLNLLEPQPQEVDVLQEVVASELVLRLRSIQVSIRDDILGEARVFESWTNQNFKAPLLERIDISHPYCPVDIGPFSTRNTPALRSLSLCMKRLDWNEICLAKNLTYLHLSQHPSSPRRSTPVMHAFLQQAPNLQELKLENCLPAPSSSNPAHLCMEYVRTLKLEDEENNLRHFHKLAHFPDACTVSITCTDVEPPVQLEFHDTSSILFAILEGLPNGPLNAHRFRRPRSVDIVNDGGGMLSAEFSFKEGIIDPYLSLVIPSLTPETPNRLIGSIAEHMDCSGIDRLYVDLTPGAVPVESWRIISRFPGLQDLTIFGWEDVLPFLEMLARPAQLEDATSTEAYPFPVLSMLLIDFMGLPLARDEAEVIIEALVKGFSGGRPPLKHLTVRDSFGLSNSDEQRLRQELCKTEVAWIDNEEFTQEEADSDCY